MLGNTMLVRSPEKGDIPCKRAREDYLVFNFFFFGWVCLFVWVFLLSSILLIKSMLFSYSALYNKSAARDKQSIGVRHPVKAQPRGTPASIYLLFLFNRS